MPNIAGSNQQPSLHSNRLAYIDSARGLCVILVVVLHTLTVEDLFNNLLYVLRMPLFYFCSGLFCAGAMRLNWSRFLATKVAPIFWVYIVWSTIVYFASFAIWEFLHGEKVDLIRPLTIFWLPAQTLWFLYALGIIYILTKIVVKLPAVIGIMLAVASYSLSMYQADLMNASFAYRILRFFPFFYFGFLLRHSINLYVNSYYKYWPVYLAAFFGITYAAFESNYLNVGPIGLMLGLLGIFSVLCLFGKFERSWWVYFLAWVGKRSIFVFVIHRIPLFYANEWLKNSEFYGNMAAELFIAAVAVGISLLAGEVLSRKVSKYFFVAPWIDEHRVLSKA
jgi:fucose 4-O-acetylase-like acetyltransferase